MIALWMLLGCSDPELDPFHDALGEYDRGQVAAAEGDWGTAAAAFERGLEAHPASPALHLWLAHAQAQGGDLAAARATLDQGVARAGGDVDLRYNRAAYAARDQDLEAAAKDLRYLYARQLLDPFVAGEDDDFRTLGVIPRFSMLAPTPRVEVEGDAPLGVVLRGEELTAALTLRTRTGHPISARAPATDGRLLHRQTIEDIVGEGEGWTMRRLSVTWEARAAGAAALGPVVFEAHHSVAETGPMAAEVTLLPGQAEQAAPQPGPETVWLPSALLGSREAPWIGRLPDGRVAAMMLPGMEGRIEGAAAPVRLEVREHGETLWRALVAPAGHNVEVVLSRGGKAVLEERVP